MSKTITRKYIQRITKREGNTNIRQGGGGGGGGGGGVSQYWVDDNYVSKEFFNRLFEIHDENGDPILPNDVETEIDNIQAMFGFWTNAYLSALGNNPGGGGAELTLASLADVAVQGVTDGQALVWNATLQKWVPGTGGIDLTAMWAALAKSGTQQIDVSHIGTALTGYATETWVGNQGYITSSALNGYATENWVGSQISDMATQTWVSGNYLTQTNAAATYLTQTNAAATYLTKTDAATTYVSIAFFERLFKAYNGSTVIHPNNTTSTIDNIQSMFGFWTNAYLSALGNNPGGGGAELTLASLADVAVQGVTDGQALVWNATLQKWVPGQGGGIDITAMWAALAQSGTQQIDASHLGTALTGYATETWVGNQGYITSSALNGYATESWVGSQISDMATKTWVGQNYLGLHATADAATKLATAHTIWGQSFDGSGNVSGDMSSVGNISFSASGKNIGGLMYFDTTNSNIGIGTSSPSYALDVVGFARSKVLFFYNRANTANAGYIGAGSSSVDYIYFQAYTNNGLYIGANNGFDFVILPNHNVGVGTTEPSYKMHVNGTFYASGNSSIGGTFGVTGATTLSSTLGVSGATTLSSTLSVSGTSTLTGHVGIGAAPHNTYVLRADGAVYVSTGLYSHGYVTALSDIRHKDVMGDVKLTVSEVASAPAVKFLWKDRRQEGLQVGSIAQYWQKVLPEAIVEAADGELTMSYGVIALLASIANAREIVNLKREIAELKRKLQIN